MFLSCHEYETKKKNSESPWGKTSFSFSLPSSKLAISLIQFGKMLYNWNFQGILLCLKGEANQVSGNQAENSKDNYYLIWTVGCFKLWQQVWQVGEACVSDWGEIRPLVCTILWLFFFFTCLLISLIFFASSQLQGVLRSLGMMVFSLGRIYAPFLVQYLSLPW